MKLVIAASLSACVCLLALAIPASPAVAPQRTQLQPRCDNTFRHEPVVVYEVTGGTLVGPVDSALLVYDDGLARYSSSLGPGPGFAFTVGVGQAAARQLFADLTAAGAMDLCDPTFVVNDVPLSTLTVLRGGTKQQGNTFSWFLPEGPTATIEGTLTAFIAAHFPPPPAGGGGSF